MIECPHCEGEKGHKRSIVPPWIEPPRYEWVQCRTCEGKGEITELKGAVYKARGGAASIKLTGYA
jgi:hypothetical protein